MWKRGVTLALVSFILVLMVFGLFACVSSLPAFPVQPSNAVESGYVPKSVVSVAYLTNQSTTQKWENYFTRNSSQANLQNIVGFLSGLGTRHSSRPECNISADYIFSTLSSYGYTPLRDYFTVMWQGTPYVTQNLYCVKPSPSSDIILLACHYDSIRALRIGTSIYGIQNTNCPGAIDDAAGVAALLETARLLANVNLGMTLVFAFLSGEEGNSTTEHWFGSEQLITQGYNLFTTQLSNIKRVIYLDTLGEPNENITIFSTSASSPQKTSLIGAASDLGINIVSVNNPRASSITEAQNQFCSEWSLQSVLPTVTISQKNWNISTSNRLTEQDTASTVDYTFVKNVAKLVTGSLVREFYDLPQSSPNFIAGWSEIVNLYPNGITLFEQDYSEYLANPNSDVVIIGPGLNFSTPELQELIAIGKPLICTGESGVRLLNSLDAQVTSVQSNTSYVLLARADLFYHPIWENVEENNTVVINQGENTLVAGGSKFFTFLEYGGDSWLRFYYGHQSLRYVFYVGRDNLTSLSGQAMHILSNLLAWGSKQEEYVLYIQPSRIVAGERTNLTMAIRSALSWETIPADAVNLTITLNGEEIYRGTLPLSGGYFRFSFTPNVGECIFTASNGSISATRTINVVVPFSVQLYSPLTTVQNQYFVVALKIDSFSSSEQTVSIFIPELQAFSLVNLPPDSSVILYVLGVYAPTSVYDQGAHLFTVLTQGFYPSVSVLPMWISPSTSSLILGYVLPLIALLAVALLVYRKIYVVNPPKRIQVRESKRVERRSYFDKFVLDSEAVEGLRDHLEKLGFEEKGENRFYHAETIVEIQTKEEKSYVKIFSSRSDFDRLIRELKLKRVRSEIKGGLNDDGE